MSSSIRFVHTTLPDKDSAQNIARELVERNLAACVSIEAEVKSYYNWQGNLQEEAEVPLLIKTCDAKMKSVKEFLLEQHPYDCPEIVVTKATEASKDFEEWVRDQTVTTTE